MPTWLKVIKLAPSSVVTSNCGYIGTIVTTNDKSSYSCRDCWKEVNTEIKFWNLSESVAINLLIMIRVIINFIPGFGWDIISFGLVCRWIVSTNSQRRSFEICQRCFMMSIFRVCMTVKNISIITTGGCKIMFRMMVIWKITFRICFDAMRQSKA